MHSTLMEWTLNGINQPFNGYASPSDMRDAIGQIKELPLLPGVALRILQIAADPDADIAQLAEVIEQDPILTAQVIRWASSPLYGYQGTLASVHDAICRVLGFDFVLNAALALTVLKPLNTPTTGTIGSESLWVQAIAGMQLMKALSARLPDELRPQASETMLAAMLHNIGFPLLGHYFPEEFGYLNTLIDANPELAVFNIEKFAFGIDHGLLGTWLMRNWHLPQALINVVYHHHNPYYQGDDSLLNRLTFLSDSLLGSIGIGDARNQPCPEEIYLAVQLSEATCYELLDALAAKLDDIKRLAKLLTTVE